MLPGDEGDMYERKVRLTWPDGRSDTLRLTVRRVIPPLQVPPPSDLALDFPYAIGQSLGVEESVWRLFGLAASRSIPMDVLHRLYDAALFYAAFKAGLLGQRFGLLAAERIILVLFATVPERLVKHRFYMGFALDDGDIDLVSGDGKEIRPTISDPYQRLFSLTEPNVFRQVKEKFGPDVHLRRKDEDYTVAGKGAHPSRTLGYNACLNRLISDAGSPVRTFLSEVYRVIRLPEAHTGRIGDNAIFEVEELASGLFKAMNYLFTQDLALAYRRTERGPFVVPLLRVAGTKPLGNGRALSSTEGAHLEVTGAELWYGRSP